MATVGLQVCVGQEVEPLKSDSLVSQAEHLRVVVLKGKASHDNCGFSVCFLLPADFGEFSISRPAWSHS